MQWRGVEYRFQLNEAAEKPPGYVMGKTEAESHRDRFRSQIRARTFRHPKFGLLGGHGSALDQQNQRLTVNDIVKEYMKRHVWQPGRRQASGKMMEYNLKTAQAVAVPSANGRMVRFGEKVFSEVVKADIEVLREPLRSRLPRAKSGLVGVNRILRRLRHLWNWAIAEGYVESTPFKRHGVPVIRMNGEAETPRHRRLDRDEENRLLAVAAPWLADLIVAALETGCRKGELLSLQWHQVRWGENCLVLPAAKTKTGEARAVPMTAMLRSVLERRQLGPDGERLPTDTYVFGNELGEPRLSIQDTWEKACKAAEILDLHFHDLRREFASRLLETPGVSVHDVSDWIGHSSVVTTTRYLASNSTRKQHVLERFEAAFASRRVEKTKDGATLGR
jgi:integrase